MSRWRTTAPLFALQAIFLALCGVAVVEMVQNDRANHRAIPFDRALTMARHEVDPNLRAGARWVLDDAVRRAIAALEEAAKTGDDAAAAMLLAWSERLHH